MLKLNKDALQDISFARGYRTLSALATRLNVPSSTFSNYLHAKRYIPEDLAIKISDLLNCPIADFTTYHSAFELDFSEYWALRKKLHEAIDKLTEEQMKLFLPLIEHQLQLNDKIQELLPKYTDDDCEQN